MDKGSASINLKSFRYYDRMYPFQDVVSSIGNLIALPLQGQALKNGNSAFVDENWNAYPNQWDILLNKTEKLGIEDVEKYMAKWQAELAEIYGYEVKRLNEQVKRNITRFPEDFMFKLTKDEIPDDFSKSQIATLNENGDKRGLHIKKVPFAFTEQGIYMLATVLRGELAEQQSIYVVDDYVNTKTLQLLSQKQSGVEVVLFTENGHGKRGFLTTSVVNDFIQEYPPLRIKPNADCHDRLIILDYGLSTEQAYHCGASSKDAGKKLCAINVILETSMIHPVIDKLLVAPDKRFIG